VRLLAIRHHRILVCLAGCLLGSTPTARSASLLSYTVTDLGSGQATLGTDANGNGTVVSADGKSAFSFPPSSIPWSPGDAAKLPLPYAGFFENSYSYAVQVAVNGQGLACRLPPCIFRLGVSGAGRDALAMGPLRTACR
jgi:hypothetical protein